MNKTHTAFITFLMALGAAQVHAAPRKAEGKSVRDDRAAFEMIKDLEGSWAGKKGSGEPCAVDYKVTAGGTAVIETLFPGTEREMVTLYSLRGSRLILTHYCSLANQPRMAFRKSREPRTVMFEFAGGDNIDVKKDMHMHALALRQEGRDGLTAEWTLWQDGERARSERFDFRRKS